jgi:DNA polymerase III gamma/tau subunit
MGLYQQIRPKTLSEVVGNHATLSALEKMLKGTSAQRPHSILLHGPSGCGKTTIGRILASEFGSNEESIIEINAANTRGIDSVRDIQSNAHLSTLGGGVKTYIIDESHQLTPAAQEAFLKVLEDYPPNTYFIFCTTEPKGIILTIRNRCTAYEVSKLPTSKILEVLEQACEKSSITVDHQILEAVAATSDGSPRAAIVALEAVKDIDDLDTAIQFLLRNTENDPDIIDLCRMMYAAPDVRRSNWRQILQIFNGLGDNPEQVRKAILTYMYNKLVTCDSESEALDLAWLINIFSYSVYYGNRAQLGSMVAKACFGTNEYL